MDSPSSTRTTAFAASAASTCAMAAGALATFGAAGIVLGAAGPPLLLASAGSAGLAVLFASLANRPARVEAPLAPSKVEPQPEIRWLESGQDAVSAAVRSARPWLGRHVGRRLPDYATIRHAVRPGPGKRLKRDLGVLAGRLRLARDAGRLRLARALHRAAMFVAPSRG